MESKTPPDERTEVVAVARQLAVSIKGNSGNAWMRLASPRSGPCPEMSHRHCELQRRPGLMVQLDTAHWPEHPASVHLAPAFPADDSPKAGRAKGEEEAWPVDGKTACLSTTSPLVRRRLRLHEALVVSGSAPPASAVYWGAAVFAVSELTPTCTQVLTPMLDPQNRFALPAGAQGAQSAQSAPRVAIVLTHNAALLAVIRSRLEPRGYVVLALPLPALSVAQQARGETAPETLLVVRATFLGGAEADTARAAFAASRGGLCARLVCARYPQQRHVRAVEPPSAALACAVEPFVLGAGSCVPRPPATRLNEHDDTQLVAALQRVLTLTADRVAGRLLLCATLSAAAARALPHGARLGETSDATCLAAPELRCLLPSRLPSSPSLLPSSASPRALVLLLKEERAAAVVVLAPNHVRTGKAVYTTTALVARSTGRCHATVHQADGRARLVAMVFAEDAQLDAAVAALPACCSSATECLVVRAPLAAPLPDPATLALVHRVHVQLPENAAPAAATLVAPRVLVLANWEPRKAHL